MSKESKKTSTVTDFIRDHKLAIGVGCGVLAVSSALAYCYIRGAADAMKTICDSPGGRNLMGMVGHAINHPDVAKIIDHANQVEYLGGTNGEGIAILYNTNRIEEVAKAIRSGAVSNTDLGPLAEAILQGLKN